MAVTKKVQGPVTSPAPKPIVRLSQIQEWNKCRYRHNLRYVREIDRRSLHRPMDLGTVTHAGAAGAIRYFGSQKARTKAIYRRTDAMLVAAVKGSLQEMVDKIGGMNFLTDEEKILRNEIEEVGIVASRRMLANLRLERWETYWYEGKPMIEMQLFYETDEFVFQATPDWVAEDLEKGGAWVLDYKIRKQFTPPESEDVNVQFPAYRFVIAANGLNTVGSVMVQSKAIKSSTPKLNLNGSMSRAKIACTWDDYALALVANGLDPADYEGDMKGKLTTEFDRIDPYYKSMMVVGRIWELMIEPAAREMLNPTRHVHRHMSHMNCQGCWARDFCLGELHGEDTDFLLESDYIDLKNPAPRLVLRPEDVRLIED